MSMHQIDINGGFNKGGYSGTVEVSGGEVKIEFPGTSRQNHIKRYHLHLLTPDKKNIEINLLRFPNGDWCDDSNLQFDFPFVFPQKDLELREAIKKEIIKMGL